VVPSFNTVARCESQRAMPRYAETEALQEVVLQVTAAPPPPDGMRVEVRTITFGACPSCLTCLLQNVTRRSWYFLVP
jgi:hypothetical protein